MGVFGVLWSGSLAGTDMIIKQKDRLAPRGSEVTPEGVYHGRRAWLRGMGALGVGAWFQRLGLAPPPVPEPPLLPRAAPGPFSTSAPPTPFAAIASYNNFYELGTGKDDPAAHAADLRTRPWRLVVAGACRRPAAYEIDDLIRHSALQDRVYRHRCVEAWSMVVPWVGVPLAEILKRVQPTGDARYVSFTSIEDPAHLPGQQEPILQWPYFEGLRIDEAMHPLTLLAVGLYGRVLPNQNGAPVRLVVPWKYGFKSAKSIVRIELVREQPVTTWMRAVPERYGFYSNVNPAVDRVPWSQREERPIGALRKRPTELFNGYGPQVASLYRGMDLERDY